MIDREGLQGCEMLRIPYFSDSRLKDGGEVVSLTGRAVLSGNFLNLFLVLI
jgi:hypothetical protein